VDSEVPIPFRTRPISGRRFTLKIVMMMTRMMTSSDRLPNSTLEICDLSPLKLRAPTILSSFRRTNRPACAECSPGAIPDTTADRRRDPSRSRGLGALLKRADQKRRETRAEEAAFNRAAR
jgi:hypothetical protein